MMERPIKKHLIFPVVKNWRPDYIIKEFKLLHKYADYQEQQIKELKETERKLQEIILNRH